MSSVQEFIETKMEKLHGADWVEVNAACIVFHLEGLVKVLNDSMGSTEAHNQAMWEIHRVLEDLAEGV